MQPDYVAEWTPFLVRWKPSGPVLDWRRMAERRFVEPAEFLTASRQSPGFFLPYSDRWRIRIATNSWCRQSR